MQTRISNKQSQYQPVEMLTSIDPKICCEANLWLPCTIFHPGCGGVSVLGAADIQVALKAASGSGGPVILAICCTQSLVSVLRCVASSHQVSVGMILFNLLKAASSQNVLQASIH